MQNITVVKFKNSGKAYSFLTNGVDLAVGDRVVVETSAGLSLGQVVVCDRKLDDVDIVEPLKPVLRKADEKDIKKYEELEQKAVKDIDIVKQKVKELKLDMKIVSAEYTLDGSKIIIEFSSEDRVDFRDLLKELAMLFKVRIELHQVGQRDEVKIKGGIGPCGEICCCSRFLNEFEHVTVKMAKNQGLSLNPTKISGLCGRLMCCLAYENKTYEDILKKMPKVNGLITTPKGNGVVVYNDILRERVSVKVLNGEDSYTIYDFSLAELNGEKQELKPEKSAENKNQNNDLKTENKIVDSQNKDQFKKPDQVSENKEPEKKFDKNSGGHDRKFNKHRRFKNSHKNSKENIDK